MVKSADDSEEKDAVYKLIADYIAHYIKNDLERMPDGAVCRVNPEFPLTDCTIWVDDLNELGWILNDTHGIGIVLLAGVEYIKLMNSL